MKTSRSLFTLLILFGVLLMGMPRATVTTNAASVAVAFTTPVASSFSTTVAANRQNAIQLQGADAEGTSLVYATTSSPAHGTLSGLNTATGALVYTPVTDYVGADSFTFTVTSGGETSAAGTVTLSVTNQKTRIIDTVTDASGAPRAGKVTFILTQATTSPAGLTPKGASVSASLNSSGQFDISVYPSRSMSPAAYYQVYFVDHNSGQTLLGIYDIPLSTATINLAPYKVLDTNLAAQYTFASQAAVSALSAAVSGAVYATLTSSNITTALGYTPLSPSSPAVAGDMTVTGTVRASSLNLVGAMKRMLATGALPYDPSTITGLYAFLDAGDLDLTQGDTFATWPDTSGNGRHAVQAAAGEQLTYDASEAGFSTTETDGAFVLATGATRNMTVPIPPDTTKTVFVVAKRQVESVGWQLLNFGGNNTITSSGNRWVANKISGGAGTTPKGYSLEWSVLAYVQNSATSVSFYVDGVLAQTFTPETNPGSQNFFVIGPGAAYVKLVVPFDSAFTSDQVWEHTQYIKKTEGISWEHVFIDVTGGHAPTLPSHGIITYKKGFKGKRPLVFLNHTYLNTERLFYDNPTFEAITRALREKGYIVAISRMYASGAGGENSWGNQQALDANADLYNYAVANLPVDTGRVAAVGFSMGCLATALMKPDGRIPLDGSACFDGVLDLAHVYSTFFTSTINTAYGIPGSGDYATRTAGHDPRLLAASNWTGQRWRFYWRVIDSTVDPVQNTGDFRTQIAGVATESGLYTLTGDHLEGIDSTAIADLMAFLARVLA